MAAATMYVDASAGGGGDGSSWAQAWNTSEWLADLTTNAEAGDIYYVRGGTYSLTANKTATDTATTQNPVKIIGVNSGTTNEPPTYSDWATGANRPIVACGGYYFFVRGEYIVHNLSFTGTGVLLALAEANSMFRNCKSYNSSGTGGYPAFTSYGINVRFVECEAQSTNGVAIDNNDSDYQHILFCYLHDSVIGIDLDYYSHVIGCGIEDCTTGIDASGVYGNIIVSNSLYNGTTGINCGTSYTMTVLNNAIDNYTTGASQSAGQEQKINWWDHNCWDNTTDVSDVTQGPYAVTADPGFNDPGNGDFSITTGDNAYDEGADIGDLAGGTV